MNVARFVIDVVAWLASVAVVAAPFTSPDQKRVLVVVLLAGIGLFTLVGMWRFYRRTPDQDRSESGESGRQYA